MTALLFARDVGALSVSVLVVLGTLYGIARRLGKLHFAAMVFHALNRNRAQYREFHEEVFRPELVRGANTQRRARRTHEIVERHVREFADFRRKLEPRIDDMLMVGKTVLDLDRTLQDFRGTIELLRTDLTQRGSEIAELRGELRARRGSVA